MQAFEFVNQLEEEIPFLDSIQKVLQIAIQKEVSELVSFSVIFVDNDYIKALNREYRGIDRITDVITFALEDETDMPKLELRLLGDIYICYPRAQEQAATYGHSLERELCFLAVHGFLHLLGYDHMDPEEEKEMFQKQEDVLNEAGITR